LLDRAGGSVRAYRGRSMRNGVWARVAGLAVMVALGTCVQPTAAFAAYAYNYGINYDVAPWDELCAHNDFAESALIAAGSQAAKGYSTSVDDECRDVWAYNNLGVASVMNLDGHGSNGRVMLVDQMPGELYVSYLTSSYSMTGQSKAPNGAQPPLLVQSTRMVVDQNNSPAKIVVCDWCRSGADPTDPPGKNMLWALVGYADADCAVGFKKPVLICWEDYFGDKSANYDWQYKYWLALKLNYNADYSRTIAMQYVLGRYGDTFGTEFPEFGSVWGYGEHNLKGDGNVRL
jgi:hypothetical protein